MLTVAIKRIDNDEVVDQIGASSNRRNLERVQRGININLGDDYYTEIQEKTNES